MTGGSTILGVLALTLTGMCVACSSPYHPTSQTTRSRISFHLAIPSQDNEKFRNDLVERTPSHTSSSNVIEVESADATQGLYVLRAARSCEWVEAILTDAIMAATETSSPAGKNLERYLAMATATAKCEGGLPAGHGACELAKALPGKLAVPDERTARRMFLLVERNLNPRVNRSKFPDVSVIDYGDRWALVRGRDPKHFLFWKEERIFGGGQLELSIAKCDGAILRSLLTE